MIESFSTGPIRSDFSQIEKLGQLMSRNFTFNGTSITLFKRIEINLFVIPLFMFSFSLNFINQLLISYLSASLHELSHIVCAIIFKIKLHKIYLLPFGLSAQLDCTYVREPKKEAIIAAVGPLANLIIILLYFVITTYYCDKVTLSASKINLVYTVNIVMFLVNMLPILPLDGGRILKCYLTNKWGFIKAFNFVIIVTKIFSVFITIAGLYILIITKFNISIILIAAFILNNLTYEMKMSELVVMKDIIYSISKLDSGSKNTNTIVSFQDELARKILKLFSYNFYHIILIIDSDTKIIGQITETELINNIILHGHNIKLIDFHNIANGK